MTKAEKQKLADAAVERLKRASQYAEITRSTLTEPSSASTLMQLTREANSAVNALLNAAAGNQPPKVGG